MRYLIMDGSHVSMDHLPARATRDEAQEVVERVNASRIASTAKAAEWAYSGRGSAFLKPRAFADNEMLSIKEIE